MDFRIESDSIGSRNVPKEAYYGVQSLRAKENFKITGLMLNEEFIKGLAETKKAAALVNGSIGLLDEKIEKALVKACDEIIDGKLHDQFIVDPIQGGAGTSANMNINEVISNRAIEILGGEKGDYKIVHPNDHANMGQSTNDIIPTAGKLAMLRLIDKASNQLNKLYEALVEKSKEFDDVIKMGRTQMQDAVPIRLGQEFNAYSSLVKRNISRINNVKEHLKVINMGGTAIGTGINADKRYFSKIVPKLSEVTKIDLVQAEDLVDATQNLDIFVEVSSVIKTCAVGLSKMSNDLRLMSSGPRTGFGEINLPSKQNGSSIMPGKVNPVIPEVMNQVAFNIIGNDVTITMAAEAGQLELNAFEPVIFYNLFQSIETLTSGVDTFTENCIKGITANEERCKDLVENSVGIITAICPSVGYKVASNVAKTSLKTGESVIDIILREGILKESELGKILHPRTMTEPGI
ncbi:aspartate ammonia-lyase [Clostridium algidicarnis]|uniref:Aspartate ammonia-lyase n=1 Tax=Clostridium algidicarnis DSM 15099 TaxID=1121295 RepID=A0A2S6FZ68_9CLOT|nr:aspartate ammonia-lyase [Clostridium algidicarnis]MBB6631050.1 aspartate ammonia-lyase [Clostridium algidicarnis]MBU3197131.1 aspartate ammonia-lyase [Clostridium algidicarnis]MBU3205909.1 aspartate ammonia-lyase [Clostridium algidicarnis]MCB2286892.1 aspartate ammonia-lyase [Clostridium algidicarnis]PPK48889.1 aspartate ammonia-lyase [Clostridium algidicarnis DSM 15099]